MKKGGSYKDEDGKKYRLDRESNEWVLIDAPKKTKTPKKTQEDD